MPINQNARENIDYVESYVAFLDILGFRNLVMSQKEEDKLKISKYLGIVDSAITYLHSIPAKSNIKTIVISDSVILSVTQENDVEQNRNLFRHLCIAVGLIQQNLALQNLWLRGGISSGKAFFHDQKKQIVGPAYVNSYELEDKYAENPRVVIDSKIIHELGCETAGEFIDIINNKMQGGLNFSNWNANILFYWHQELLVSGNYIPQDLPLFIDYLSPNIDLRSNNLQIIIDNLKTNIYKDVKFYDKYRWVVDYLKSIYLTLDNVDPDIEKMLINL